MRTGLRRTMVEDIARELGRTRPVVYRYVEHKNDAFRKVARLRLTQALDEARSCAGDGGAVAARVFGVLDAKLRLAVRIHRDSPHHANEILTGNSGLVADLVSAYIEDLARLVVDAMSEVMPRAWAREHADIDCSFASGARMM